MAKIRSLVLFVVDVGVVKGVLLPGVIVDVATLSKEFDVASPEYSKTESDTLANVEDEFK
jgi:hypothetical protein